MIETNERSILTETKSVKFMHKKGTRQLSPKSQSVSDCLARISLDIVVSTLHHNNYLTIEQILSILNKMCNN